MQYELILVALGSPVVRMDVVDEIVVVVCDVEVADVDVAAANFGI